MVVNIRVDPAPVFRSLPLDTQLPALGIQVILADEKNWDENPIAERAISGLLNEIKRIQPTGGPLSESTLALATAALNARSRSSGLSATEMWTKRDQFTGEELPVHDRLLLLDKHANWKSSHLSSAKYKARGLTQPLLLKLGVGDLVYLLDAQCKTKSRDRYLVVSLEHPYVQVQKFVGTSLRSRRNRVRISDCSPIQQSPPPRSRRNSSSSSEYDLPTGPTWRPPPDNQCRHSI